jgi:phage tail-like protein
MNPWAQSTVSFRATLFGNVAVPFQQVAGLDSGTQNVEYRQPSGPAFSPVTMPALGSVGDVTLRSGVFANDAAFWSWVDSIRMSTVARGTVTIVLLDESGAPTMTWTLTNAWPTRITGADPQTGGSEVAVESVEIAYETMAVSTA